mgnify:CR=1 FL=1
MPKATLLVIQGADQGLRFELNGGEVTLGRGSFTESFPLFGFALDDYEVLFSEKLDLFARLRGEGPISWEGTVRRPLVEAQVHPKTQRGKIGRAHV